MEDPNEYFVARKSTILDGGVGIFAIHPIAKNMVFRINHSRPRCTDRVPDGIEALDLHTSSDVDLEGPCVIDGRRCTLKDAPTLFRRKFVHAKRSQCLIMKANDMAWTIAQYETDYSKNKLELIMVFENGRAIGVAATTNEHIGSGEECGITYGTGYWFSHDEMS